MSDVKLARCSLLLLLGLAFLWQTASDAGAEDTNLLWGTTAATVGAAWAGSPSLEALLADQSRTLSLTRFYCAGGKNAPATPTECRIAYNAETLFVVFRCAEPDLSFPALTHGADWYSQLHSPSEQDAAFPDKVDFFISPDIDGTTFYQFAATLAGKKFGCKRHWDRELSSGEDPAPASVGIEKIAAFEASVTRREKEWLVFLRIPWKTLGGKPASVFGLMPMRTRWRDAEVSSPVAAAIAERPPPDLFIETHFSNVAAPIPAQTCVCRLPSGTLRWQRPALLSYPALNTREQIWRLQQSLPQPASADDFAQRVFLTQRWLDLLSLEGFNYRNSAGSIVEGDLTPSVIRSQVNVALRKNHLPAAWALLDAYLRKLDKASRQWFADGSPGNILSDEWRSVSEVKSVETNGQVLALRCLAGDRTVDLHLSLPETGGVRLYGDDEGFFKPAGLLPLAGILRESAPADAAASSNAPPQPSHGRRWSLATSNATVIIDAKPFEVSIRDAAGAALTAIGPASLAFRFSPQGKVLAVDFKHSLDHSEVIYGFGEKYDRFDENGNVLTLWGVDDWIGLTVGLRNQTYKPVPVLHSSKGYSVFVNSSYRLRADVGKTRADEYRLSQHGPVFDYYFWVAPPERALQSYTSLTGKPFLPPKWAFEPWMGRTGRGWTHTPQHDPVAEQERVTKRFAALDIPHSAIYAEGSAADSPALHAFMAARGIKVLSWFYPAIPEAAQAKLLPEMKPNELPVLRVPDNPAAARDLGYVDFTHPNALELSRRWWARRLHLGLAGSMVDFGDRVPEDAVFYDGRRGDEMHNFYSYDYQRTYHDVFQEKRGDDFILFGRAAAPGTQRWVAQFAGDHPANFTGLRDVFTGALNLSACGFSFWGSDLGGFLGWPEPAVYIRWTQFACFSPLMRCHGRTPREPWEYGDRALANYKRCAWVRENLLDYIYAAAVDSHNTGIPLMRSMAVAYPRELSLAGTHDQYMFGGDLLVAPVVTEDDHRPISFPPGRWTSLWDGQVSTGPNNIQTSVRLDDIPVYLRPGAIVPVRLNQDLQFGESMTHGRITALVLTPPQEPRAVLLSNTGNNLGEATTAPSPKGFAVTLTNLPGLLHLLIYDAEVTEVKADGEVLPKLEAAGFNSGTAGWCLRPATRQVLVRLPTAAASRIPASRSIEFLSHSLLENNGGRARRNP